MNKEYEKNCDAIRRQIADMPQGGVTYKKINGKSYAYYQWRENGKQRNRRIKDDEIAGLVEQIEERKRLEGYLRESEIPYMSTPRVRHSFNCDVRIGDSLRRFVEPVSGYVKRDCYYQLHEYIYGSCNDKVFILYGLRRTGKTTLVRQLIGEMADSDCAKTVFLQINEHNTLAEVNADLRSLEEQGYRYVFLDEVTLMSDFIEGAALFSDIYASSGMKLVLSGTDSLGFVFSQDEQLYDRCIMLHTTHISYGEFEKVQGIHGIDNYIRYGGTMSMSGVNYNSDSTFSNIKNANDYVDSAIARNIQHSLKYYQYGGHFRHLKEIYDNGELTNVINRVVEDINHRFALEVLNREFKSHDLAISANNLRRDRHEPSDVLDKVDADNVNNELKLLMSIFDVDERKIKLDKIHVSEIEEYLRLLDIVVPIETRSINGSIDIARTGIIQPGLRYAQALHLINTLMKDPAFAGVSLVERRKITSRIESEILGRMLEDIILVETQVRYPDKEVFALQFDVGEFDMVVFDNESASCEIYEIKHSTEIAKEQYRHLTDAGKCADTEFHYGAITGRYVIYRGQNAEVDGVKYINAEEYLKRVAR